MSTELNINQPKLLKVIQNRDKMSLFSLIESFREIMWAHDSTSINPLRVSHANSNSLWGQCCENGTSLCYTFSHAETLKCISKPCSGRALIIILWRVKYLSVNIDHF